MAATTFQATVGTSAVQATGVSAIATAVPRYGVRVSLPSSNTGKVYWGVSSGVTTATGCLLPAGGETTINAADLPLTATGTPDLSLLYFIADAAAQVLTGAVV